MNKFCMKCGSEIDQTTGLCPQCSQQNAFEPNKVQDTQDYPEKHNNKNKILLAVVVIIVVFAIVLGVVSASKLGERTNEPSESNKQEEIETTEPETYVTTLTEGQLKSFENLLNGMPRSLDAMEDHFNKTDAVVGTFICSSFWNQPKDTMFDYYFNNDYKTIQKDDGYSVTYEFDAEKVLFILNDVFGLNATKDLSRAKYYFKDNKFYYSTMVYGMGYETVTYSVDSYEYITDGYFKIKTNYTHTDYDGNVNKGDSRYYIVKPANHQEYGDYWKFREIGFEDNVIWTNDASYKDDTIGWKKPLIDTVYDFNRKNSDDDIEYYLFDMENDGVPELLAEYESRYGGEKLMLFYFNGQTYESNEFSSESFYYVPGGKNVLISYRESGCNYDDVYTLKNGKLTKVATGKYLDELVPGYGSEYFWEENKIMKEEYNKKLNSYLNTQKKVSYKDVKSYDYENLYDAISDYPI